MIDAGDMAGWAGSVSNQAQVIPCADVPYRCDGFDPADWPGDVPAAVHELAAILARNAERPS